MLLLFVGLLPASGWAQTTIAGKKQIAKVQPDSSYFLALWVLEESIQVAVADSLLDPSQWRYEHGSGNWRWTPHAALTSPLDSVVIAYLRYPIPLRRRYYQREIVAVDSSFQEAGSDTVSQQVVRRRFTEQDLFGDVNLDRSGSLTRGVTVGSNRDLALESGLRFDLNGQITDDVEIVASLTDQSTPIQPDGSTQNLREFDRVYIRLQSPSTQVQLGDIDISLQESEFARIDRRLQGVSTASDTKLGNYMAHSLWHGDGFAVFDSMVAMVCKVPIA